MLVLQNFIGGEFLDAKVANFIDSYNPSTGKVYAKIPDSTEDDINFAVEAAHKAFTKWSKTHRSVRANIMYRIADILESRQKEFAEAEVRDQGKTITFATNIDINRSIYNFRYFAGYLLHMEEKASILDGRAFNYVKRTPSGVAGLISPWNLPLYLLTWKIAPCIAAGCACVCKPSEFTSVTAFMLCSVLKEAGLPDGVVNMVFGTGPNAGQALVAHPKVRLISFTGGTVSGLKVNTTASMHLKKVSLELGGKNANIIFEDCDFENAVTTSIKSSFSNQGEICLCGSRIFVQSSIYQKFLDAFVPKARDMIVGDPTDPQTEVGALISKSHMEKVLGYIELAKQEGGVIECGGGRKELKGELCDGYFVEPTVITNLKPSCRVAQEEIFGPVVTIHPFETEEEVINLANDSPYGLSCSVWSQNGSRMRRVAEAIDVGTVWVNCWLWRDLSMPFGGTKKSGVGREGGEYSMEFYTEQKTVCLAD
ncbi:aldehyde dehydrogenase [Gigaspora margarita]|uniref:Aldehyde dehydrogenase n=1 Tax=Gigaspora margarita TaxID=4874 RepID=A0A8H4A8A6_GIGMA|nr:aldehyde dehydrogenase [Gigaspora margarita]